MEIIAFEFSGESGFITYKTTDSIRTIQIFNNDISADLNAVLLESLMRKLQLNSVVL